jgi:hypothetical protein
MPLKTNIGLVRSIRYILQLVTFIMPLKKHQRLVGLLMMWFHGGLWIRAWV